MEGQKFGFGTLKFLKSRHKKHSFDALICSTPQNPRWLAKARGPPPGGGSGVAFRVEDNRLWVDGEASVHCDPFLRSLQVAATVPAPPRRAVWGGPQPGSRAWPCAGHPLPGASVRPGPAQTDLLPLNAFPWICQPQERHWHSQIMKLKTSATQSSISFHVLNI